MDLIIIPVLNNKGTPKVVPKVLDQCLILQRGLVTHNLVDGGNMCQRTTIALQVYRNPC